jgi:hypothetical protein
MRAYPFPARPILLYAPAVTRACVCVLMCVGVIECVRVYTPNLLIL